MQHLEYVSQVNLFQLLQVLMKGKKSSAANVLAQKIVFERKTFCVVKIA